MSAATPLCLTAIVVFLLVERLATSFSASRTEAASRRGALPVWPAR
jgi:hypothetical protein